MAEHQVVRSAAIARTIYNFFLFVFADSVFFSRRDRLAQSVNITSLESRILKKDLFLHVPGALALLVREEYVKIPGEVSYWSYSVGMGMIL